MTRFIPVIFTLSSSMIIFGCDDNNEVPQKPQEERSVTMSYGDSHYRIQRYDAQNRISEVVSGAIDNAEDSVETLYRVAYAENMISRISTADNSHVYQYTYTGTTITESRQSINNQLVEVNEFYYNAAGQIELWVIKQAQTNEWVPFQRKIYDYDAAGNNVSMELEAYDPITKGHMHVSTSSFEDFDGKKNSGSLFASFDHPYFAPFINNARTWRIENANGSVGETQYTYHYNADGYVTSQQDQSGNLVITYQLDSY